MRRSGREPGTHIDTFFGPKPSKGNVHQEVQSQKYNSPRGEWCTRYTNRCCTPACSVVMLAALWRVLLFVVAVDEIMSGFRLVNTFFSPFEPSKGTCTFRTFRLLLL